mmetsp:Transcript_3268/g.8336  ORF Transcript_3268/g.8336 Transcript_3268/m.8336 type:complete len:91 (-) Transcript_3268:69-341(-)
MRLGTSMNAAVVAGKNHAYRHQSSMWMPSRMIHVSQCTTITTDQDQNHSWCKYKRQRDRFAVVAVAVVAVVDDNDDDGKKILRVQSYHGP